MKKKVPVLVTLLLFCVAFLSAQNADALTRMIETDQATVGQTAYFLAVYRDFVSENATEEESVAALQGQGICKADVKADELLTYKEFSGLLMKTFKIKGGLMYSLTKSDRYAFREMQVKGYIPASADPAAVISGYEILAVITDCLEDSGDE